MRRRPTPDVLRLLLAKRQSLMRAPDNTSVTNHRTQRGPRTGSHVLTPEQLLRGLHNATHDAWPRGENFMSCCGTGTAIGVAHKTVALLPEVESLIGTRGSFRGFRLGTRQD